MQACRGPWTGCLLVLVLLHGDGHLDNCLTAVAAQVQHILVDPPRTMGMGRGAVP